VIFQPRFGVQVRPSPTAVVAPMIRSTTLAAHPQNADCVKSEALSPVKGNGCLTFSTLKSFSDEALEIPEFLKQYQNVTIKAIHCLLMIFSQWTFIVESYPDR